MFAFLQRSDGIETFYSNICISIARLWVERHETLKKKWFTLGFGTKTRFFQIIFDNNRFLQEISLAKPY